MGNWKLFVAGSVLGLALVAPTGARAQAAGTGSSSAGASGTGTSSDTTATPSEQPGGKVTIEKGGAPPDSELRHVTFTVKQVDKANHTVTFTAKVSPEANIEKNGQPIRIDQLRPGDEVRAAFDPSTGEVMKVQMIGGPTKKSTKTGSESSSGK